MLYNNSILKDRRRELRKRQTDAESLVWDMVRKKQINGKKFFRQYSVGPYILDFYSAELRLAIELDGGQHAEKEHVEYDRERTQYLLAHNITVIRFWNNEVTENPEDVYEKIMVNCAASSLPPLNIRGGRGSYQK
jgi:very-short-patch-repair endonuclease